MIGACRAERVSLPRGERPPERRSANGQGVAPDVGQGIHRRRGGVGVRKLNFGIACQLACDRLQEQNSWTQGKWSASHSKG
jgi:hypothetical protein